MTTELEECELDDAEVRYTGDDEQLREVADILNDLARRPDAKLQFSRVLSVLQDLRDEPPE